MTLNLFGIDVTAEIGAVTAAMAAVAAGVVGLNQYLQAERWKRAEFAIREVHRSWNDDTLAFCCCAIDWGVGPLVIPLKYLALFPVGVTTVEHDWALMAKALRPKLDASWSNPTTRAQFLLYRRAFDEFFGYLDGLAMYRALRLVREQELSPLRTYIRQLREPLYWTEVDREKVPEVTPSNVFADFIQAFYSERVWPWVANG